jgi:protein TonB
MFEQAVLSNGPASQRAWTTFAGVTGQALLVTIGVMIPMIWPDAMPSHQTLLRVFSPGAPPPPPPAGPKAGAPVTRAVARQVTASGLVLPHSVPPVAQILVDPPEIAGGGGVAGGVPGGVPNGIPGSLLQEILRPIVPVVAPPQPVEHHSAAPARIEAAVIPRYKEGGLVHLGAPIRRVEPLYPRIAVQAHIAGVVELEGVVGIDGRIRELRVKSGNPLLAPAALEAVRQWIYEPTTLNGDPVEVIAPITVTFRLN